MLGQEPTLDGAPGRGFTCLGSWPYPHTIRLDWIGMPETNNLAFYEYYVNCGRKNVSNIGPWLVFK
jgi:hypothetical protein